MREFKFRTAVAWTGGAAFVLSLGYFLYFYMVGLAGAPLTPRDWPYAFGFDVALFTIFALHHSVMARSGVKAAIARVIPESLERSSYVWIASVLLFLTCWLWRPVGGRLYDHTGVWRLAHLLIQLAGVWIIALATRTLDPLELAGIRQAAPAMRAPAMGPISDEGLYGVVRHPIYLGWLFLTFGVANMTIDRMVFATISAIYLLIAIPFEERSLAAAFGEQYDRYKQQVPWRIVPYVW